MASGENPRDCWETPRSLVEEAARRWAGGAFDLDVAASAANAKAPDFFTIEQDGLNQHWHGRVWCNPPYSDIFPWVLAACREVGTFCDGDEGNASVVVMLLPSRTGSRWYSTIRKSCFVEGIHPIRGRVKFIPPPNVEASSNPEDSLLVVFRNQLFGGRFKS